MLRLIHTQTIQGAVLIDDIDDGLPNKTAHRLGSTADPNAYARDGYANKSKQGAYVPFYKTWSVKDPVTGLVTQHVDQTVAGYLDLAETARVTLSAGKGKILKFSGTVPVSQPSHALYPLITVVSFVPADVAAPVITTAVRDNPYTRILITGTGLNSLTPNRTTITFTGTGAIVVPQTGAGVVIATDGTTIEIPAALAPSVVVATSSVQVLADDLLSGVVALMLG